MLTTFHMCSQKTHVFFFIWDFHWLHLSIIYFWHDHISSTIDWPMLKHRWLQMGALLSQNERNIYERNIRAKVKQKFHEQKWHVREKFVRVSIFHKSRYVTSLHGRRFLSFTLCRITETAIFVGRSNLRFSFVSTVYFSSIRHITNNQLLLNHFNCPKNTNYVIHDLL